MNPLTPQGNTSQEAARARELADLVHKTKLGSHTDHAKDTKPETKVFDTQPSVTTPTTQPDPKTPTPLSQTPLATEASLILKQAHLVVPDKPASLPRLTQPVPVTTLISEKPLERIDPNPSLANQSVVLHTLTQDVESLVKDRKISMVRAIALESDAPSGTGSPRLAQFSPRPPSSPKSILGMLTALCVILALSILGVSWYLMQTAPTTDSQVRARYDSGLLFFEHSQPYDITDLASYEILGGLAHLRDTVPSSLGSFTTIDVYRTDFDPVSEKRVAHAVSLNSLTTSAQLHVPEQLAQALTGVYMVLVHQAEAPRPVLLLESHEPDAAFAGMLAWEKQLPQDMSPFFPRGTLALTATPPQFKDISFNNIDARALYDGDGTLIILYALLERTVIAVTNSQTTMGELANRLHTQRLKK